MEKYNIVWGDYILNKQPLTLAKAKQELQGLKYHEPEIKKAKTMKISELKAIIKEEVSKALNSMQGMKKMSPGYYKGKYKGVEFEVVKVMEVDASTRNKWYWLIGKEGGDDWYSKKEIAKYYAMQWIEEEL